MPNESYNLVSELLDFVEAGEHTPFDYIRNFQDYLFARQTRKALKALNKSLEYKAEELFNSYCEDVKIGSARFEQLATYKTIIKILNFYIEECDITNNMIKEYEAYLWAGNFISQLFFKQRPDEDLYDHRS